MQAENALDQMDWMEKITGVIATLLSAQTLVHHISFLCVLFMLLPKDGKILYSLPCPSSFLSRPSLVFSQTILQRGGIPTKDTSMLKLGLDAKRIMNIVNESE